MILGWSEGFHDAAACVLDGPNILFASHSERFSGNKHEKFISPELKQYIARNYEPFCDAKVFFEKPLLKKTRQLYAGQYNTVFSKRQLAWKPTNTYHHHLSHAAAAFQTSNLDEAAAIVVDSIGEWTTTSIWKCTYDNWGRAVPKVNYQKVYNKNYPDSIGLWYTALTAYVGLRPLDEEYIFMGMAAFGEVKGPLVTALTLLLEGDAGNLHRGINKEWAIENNLPNYKDTEIAAAAQVVLEKKLHDLFVKAKSISRNVVYGGGVALNCVANSKLKKEVAGEFWIMPNPGDAGGALGAACLEWGSKVNWTDPYLGYDIVPSKPRRQLAKDVVKHLLKERMCGVAVGRAEYGPRALGNRSLIADPRGDDIKDLVNTVKRRQKFRPFAPAVLKEHAHEYFHPPYGEYMQHVAYIKEEHKDSLPAILHVDDSCRVQTVAQHEDTIFRDILELWYAKTGCPILLNTSLNIRGEPMVNDISDASRFETKYGIKVFS